MAEDVAEFLFWVLIGFVCSYLIYSFITGEFNDE